MATEAKLAAVETKKGEVIAMYAWIETAYNNLKLQRNSLQDQVAALQQQVTDLQAQIQALQNEDAAQDARLNVVINELDAARANEATYYNNNP